MVTLYLDEDVELDLVDLFADQGIRAIHVSQIGRKSESDAAQLAFASANGWITLVYNIGDYFRLNRQGVPHIGIIGLRRTSLDRVVLRALMILDGLDHQWAGRLVLWSAIQQRFENGERFGRYTEAEVRYAMGREDRHTYS